MKMRPRANAFGAAMLALLILTGCDISKTGISAQYSENSQMPLTVVLPANAPNISQQFRYLTHDAKAREAEGTHYGIDVLYAAGTPVLATAPGRIVKSFAEPFFGNTMVIDHGPDENGLVVQSFYRHLQQRIGKVGDDLQRGQQFATLGATGFLSGGFPHLHFEIHRETDNGAIKPLDPHFLWANGIGQVTCFADFSEAQYQHFAITYPVPCE